MNAYGRGTGDRACRLALRCRLRFGTAAGVGDLENAAGTSSHRITPAHVVASLLADGLLVPATWANLLVTLSP